MLSVTGVIALTLLAAAVAAIAQYFLKKGIRKFDFNLKDMLGAVKNRNAAIGVLAYAASFAIYIYALHATPVISFVYPIFASTFVFVLLISIFAFREKAGAYRIAGIFLIVLGIALVSLTAA